jgi:hypothetical protein
MGGGAAAQPLAAEPEIVSTGRGYGKKVSETAL